MKTLDDELTMDIKKIKRLNFQRRFIHYFLLNIARILFFFIPHKIYGKENLPAEGEPTLFVSNHISHIDSVFTSVSAFPIKRAVHWAGAADFMQKWWLRWTKYELAFPVGRGPKEREKFIKQSVFLIKDGLTVGIYPEGRRSRSGKFKPSRMKVGAGWIAHLAGRTTKVIPIYVHNTNKIIPIGRFFRLNFKNIVYCTFGKPLDLERYYKEPKSPEVSKKITKEIIRGIKKQRRLFYNAHSNV